MATSKKKWVQIDKPIGAYFLEGPGGNCGARVRPIKTVGCSSAPFSRAWEWSTWRGRKSKGRVLHDVDVVCAKKSNDRAALSRAKRAAEKKLAAACRTR